MKLRRTAIVAATSLALIPFAPSSAHAAADTATVARQAPVAAVALPPYRQWIADVSAVAADAQQYLDDRLPAPGLKAAIVLDIDNTALQTAYRPGLQSPATGPILQLARQARADGAVVFFVTARPELLRLQTQGNLRAVGYTAAGIYMRPWFDTRTDDALKTAARAEIERKGYRIVANIGNNDTDLSGGHAERVFKLPDYDGQLG